MPNFVTSGDSWDKNGNTLAAILPGGRVHPAFIAYLDRLAAFLKSLEVNGVAVPVLLRPFHEMNGGWFWWGDPADGANLVTAWRFYVDYLRNVKGVQNVVIVWAPNAERASTVDRYMKYWPGTGYVDVVGMDGYDNGPTPQPAGEFLAGSFSVLSRIAKDAGLPVCVSEIGFRSGGQAIEGFWTRDFLPALKRNYARARYVLIWSTAYGPKKGTPASDSFRDLITGGAFLLDGDIDGKAIYGTGFSRGGFR